MAMNNCYRDIVNELEEAIDADYYRRAVEFREDMFIFSGPQKTGRIWRLGF